MGIIDGFPQLHRPLISLLHGYGTRWTNAQRGREAEVDEHLIFFGLNQAILNKIETYMPRILACRWILPMGKGDVKGQGHTLEVHHIILL